MGYLTINIIIKEVHHIYAQHQERITDPSRVMSFCMLTTFQRYIYYILTTVYFFKNKFGVALKNRHVFKLYKGNRLLRLALLLNPVYLEGYFYVIFFNLSAGTSKYLHEKIEMVINRHANKINDVRKGI